MPTTECDHCGLCCQKLIIEIDHLDAVREPRLLERVSPLRGADGKFPDDPWDRQYMLACGSATNGCFLHVDGRCAVYPTRPNACVSFVAGSPHCQRLRHEAGLPPLGLAAWPDGDELEMLLYPDDNE